MWRSQKVAEDFGARCYVSACVIHGVTAHFTHSGACTRCFPSSCVVGGDCEHHGPTAFYKARRICRGCFSATGRPRVAGGFFGAPTKRRDAARARQETFTEQCLLHGFVPFSVKTGLCTVCFDTRGKPRKFGVLGPTPPKT